MREIRFSLGSGVPDGEGPRNSWAGWPASAGLDPFVVLRAVVSGEPDASTGYLCNIKEMDRLLRERAVRRVGGMATELGVGLPARLAALAVELGRHAPAGTRLERMELQTTPYMCHAVTLGERVMVELTSEFEFSASHRLFCHHLSDEENERIFGKCANAHGHGHNYVVRVTLRGDADDHGGSLVGLEELTRVVNESVIARFDHKHLNEDCREFAELNPTVENIARVIYDKLDGAFGRAALARVRVYETPKTYAEYAGG